jgi:hypothetical protein
LGLRRPLPPIQATRDGYSLHLEEDERDVLSWLLSQLRDWVAKGEKIEAFTRLTPPAYHLADDHDAEDEYQRFMGEELVASRLAAIQLVDEFLGEGTTLDDGQLTAFMQSINAVRLVLGTILDVSEDDDDTIDDADGDDGATADPHEQERSLYAYLGYLLQSAVEAAQQKL